MKDNLENSIKESLKEYEMPYDANAWTSMNKRLDQTIPTTPKSNLKWYLGGAAAVAVIATSIAIWNNTDSNSTKKIEPSQQTSSQSFVKENVENTNSESQNITSENSTSSELSPNSEVNSSNQNGSIENIDANKENTTSTNSAQNSVKGTLNQTNTSTNSLSPNSTDVKPTSKKVEVQSVSNICFGETTIISNKNDVILYILDPSGNKTSIKASKTLSFSPENEGKHTIGYLENGQFKGIEIFHVLNAPKVDFSIDDQTKYENGLPTVNLSTSSIGTSFVWNFEKQQGNETGKDVSVHYFNKGTYSVSLTVQGTNGCTAVESKTLRIEDDYNLLAVTAFDPLSNDLRKSSFIPYALTQRTVDFNMIIIDPKDGATIFESNDATNTWKGIDRRNGQLVDANKTYIWRVVLDNPEKGEKSEYKGTIIRM